MKPNLFCKNIRITIIIIWIIFFVQIVFEVIPHKLFLYFSTISIFVLIAYCILLFVEYKKLKNQVYISRKEYYERWGEEYDD